MRSFKIDGKWSVQTNIHTRAQCSHFSGRVAQAHPNHISLGITFSAFCGFWPETLCRIPLKCSGQLGQSEQLSQMKISSICHITLIKAYFLIPSGLSKAWLGPVSE